MTLLKRDLCVVCQDRPRRRTGVAELPAMLFCKPCALSYDAARAEDATTSGLILWLAARIHNIDGRKTGKLRRTLEQHCENVMTVVQAVQALYEHELKDGRRRTAITSTLRALDNVNDAIRYGTLGVNFRTDKKQPRRPVDIKKLPGLKSRT